MLIVYIVREGFHFKQHTCNCSCFKSHIIVFVAYIYTNTNAHTHWYMGISAHANAIIQIFIFIQSNCFLIPLSISCLSCCINVHIHNVNLFLSNANTLINRWHVCGVRVRMRVFKGNKRIWIYRIKFKRTKYQK